MNDDFADIGLGPGIKPAGQNAGQLLPEQMDLGVGAVYDRVIRAGGTPEQARREVEKSVYGFDAVKGKDGKYIQQGVGAWPHKVTLNSLGAIKKYEGETAYTNMLKKLWREAPDRARKIGAPELQRIS